MENMKLVRYVAFVPADNLNGYTEHTLYCLTDGKGKYLVCHDGSVFFSSPWNVFSVFEDVTEKDLEVPNCTSKEVMVTYNHNEGNCVYDQNMKLLYRGDTVYDCFEFIEDNNLTHV